MLSSVFRSPTGIGGGGGTSTVSLPMSPIRKPFTKVGPGIKQFAEKMPLPSPLPSSTIRPSTAPAGMQRGGRKRGGGGGGGGNKRGGARQAQRMSAPGPEFGQSMNAKLSNLWSRVHVRNGDIGRRRSLMIIANVADTATAAHMGAPGKTGHQGDPSSSPLPPPPIMGGPRRTTRHSPDAPPNMPVDANVWVRCTATHCPMDSSSHWTSPLTVTDLAASQTRLRHQSSPGIDPFWVNEPAVVHHVRTSSTRNSAVVAGGSSWCFVQLSAVYGLRCVN